MVNWKRVALAGLVASMAMGMVEMVYEAFFGAGFWAPVVFIAATVLRDLQNVSTPVPFLFVPVVLGLMAHMMNSVILGGIFGAATAPRLRGQLTLLGGGMVYGLVVFATMWLVVVPLVDPVMLRLNGLVFATAHLMWGGALGLVLGWRDIPVATAQPAHQRTTA